MDDERDLDDEPYDVASIGSTDDASDFFMVDDVDDGEDQAVQ